MRTHYLENRIPPPIVLVIGFGLVWVTKFFQESQHLANEDLRLWAIPYALMGIGVMALAVMRFVRFQTTVNPLAPQDASHLVKDGIFAYTRNPMYLGMALLLFSMILYGGHSIAMVWLLLFVLYIHVFQILPEERAMQAIFGEEYAVYCREVRRWL